MKHICLLITSFLLGAAVYAAPPTILNLSQAIKQNIVTIEAVTTGYAYNKQALKLKVKNNGSLTFNLLMNDGVIFTCDSGNYQPLILAGGEKLYMSPLKETEISVQTFCANSSMLSPIKGLPYSFSEVAGDTLVKVLGYIKQNRLYNDLGQSAVWMFTNEHSLNSVYDANNDYASQKLLTFITATLGVELPDYHVQSAINNTPGEEVYSPKTLKIFAKFEKELEEPKVLTLGIFNSAGEMIQPVFEDRRYGKAGHRFKVEFEAKDVPAGKYYIRLKEGDAVLEETMVEVE